MFSFNKRKRFCIITPGMLLYSFSLFAQPNHYSLPGLIDSAKKNLPVLMQKKALISAAEAKVTDAVHSFLPQLKFSEQLNIGSANSMAGSFFTFGITPSTSGSIRAENNLAAAAGNVAVVYGEYELVNFGLKNARINNAKASLELEKSDLKKEEYYLALNVARLYFGLLKTQSRLNADRQNINRYQDIFTIIQALTLSGIKAGADTSLAKAELSRTRISYNQTQGVFNQLKEQLAYLTGIPSANLQFDTAVTNAVRQVPAAADFKMDTLANPLVDYYSRKKDILLSNEILIRKNYLPRILLAASSWARGSSIRYNDQYKPLLDGLPYQRFNYAAGITFTYNLFNGIYKKDKLSINWYQLQASEYELQQQKLALRSSALQAEQALQTTIANLKELPVQLQSAQDTYQQKVAQYKAGLISLIDLTNASFVLYRSQTDYTETLNDWYQAQLDKAAATGNLDQFIQTIK